MRNNYAFIIFENHESAVSAIEEMNGKTFVNNERLTVE